MFYRERGGNCIATPDPYAVDMALDVDGNPILWLRNLNVIEDVPYVPSEHDWTPVMHQLDPTEQLP